VAKARLPILGPIRDKISARAIAAAHEKQLNCGGLLCYAVQSFGGKAFITPGPSSRDSGIQEEILCMLFDRW
jgi:hypothetical protein